MRAGLMAADAATHVYASINRFLLRFRTQQAFFFASLFVIVRCGAMLLFFCGIQLFIFYFTVFGLGASDGSSGH